MDQKTIGFRLPATSSCSVRCAEPSIEASDRRRANAVTTSIYRTALALRIERGTRSSAVTIRTQGVHANSEWRVPHPQRRLG